MQIMQIMEKMGYKKFSAWCKGVSSNMDLIGRLGAMQLDVHSHMMVKLSAVGPSM